MEFWKIFRLIIVWCMMLLLHYVSHDETTGEARTRPCGNPRWHSHSHWHWHCLLVASRRGE
jgi:hypothetical protein